MARLAAPSKSPFGARVRSGREERGFSKGQLADRLGWSASFLDLVERGVRGCDPDDLPRIAEALSLDAHQLAKLYLSERYPALSRVLFEGTELPAVYGSSPNYIEDVHWRLDQLPRRERGIVETLVLALHDLTTRRDR